ncbi:lysophospholipid acyltransferase family protein [Meiothermus granaticius]|uniref:1-acylglycerol-3-phosphate O-acyltransferase n=1 Tax=Meiothermus granaticius NBRC 107808 TaxID=1227551 RepID=A0A399F7E6_9DEIN|nr:lysophospholipid acyltransferase family protein [Meiothermus granaticius]MCL6525937.1 lysophospholipid acyltransferase family protein [Thermaceae bacterium]RIH91586.1 1-acylglycerol-3-phosphate O-acyltransferase [Meiothermus granaticius NBRC 107808]GEM85429.1 acyltransferase [Meiothermus granaticius NBRC 107808]
MYAIPPPYTPRQALALGVLRLLGWRAVMAPPPGRKFILVGYPHTSNWDFPYAVLWAWASGTRFRWVGKKELFPPVLGAVMRWLGGIPVDRSKRGGDFVRQVARLFERYDSLWVVVAVDGTRSRAEYWRTGFYYMALEAGVPLALAYIDYPRREVGIGGYFMPTGDLEADFEHLKAFFSDKVGKNPGQQTPIRLKPKDGLGA